MPDIEVSTIGNQLVDAFHDEFRARFSTSTGVHKRMLKLTDEQICIGVVLRNWVPDQETLLIGQENEPALGRYSIQIMNMVKNTNEEDGRAQHNAQTSLIRVILYRSPSLRVRLRPLEQSVEGTFERIKRWGIRKQDHMNSSVSGAFTYLTITDVFVDCEMTLDTPGGTP